MPDTLTAATRALNARFRRQRPLRAGSLLITIFGDAVAPHGGAIALASLIRLAHPFGAGERLVRTSVARLAHDGWLSSSRSGRTSEYSLTAVGWRRFAEATRRIYGSAPERWRGYWTLLLLPLNGSGGRALSRPGRKELREELRWLGFGQVGPGLLAHPTRTVNEVRAQLHDLGARATRLALFEARSGDPEADRRLAAIGWDLDQLGQRYRKFVQSFEPVLAALRRSADPDARTAFVIRTLLIHEYRKIHLRDPLLPADLLPGGWIGNGAYELCRELYSRVFERAEVHFAAVARRTRGELPPLEPRTYDRFGGLAGHRRASAQVPHADVVPPVDGGTGTSRRSRIQGLVQD